MKTNLLSNNLSYNADDVVQQQDLHDVITTVEPPTTGHLDTGNLPIPGFKFRSQTPDFTVEMQ